MPYVDNAPIAETPPTKAERRDIQVERDCEEYDAMYAKVEDEMIEAAFGWGYGSPKPDSRRVHHETMRRLKEKYAQ